MKRASDIQEELAALGATMLSEASATMPFGLPSNYFSEQISALMAIATSAERPIVGIGQKAQPFVAPSAAYFEGFANTVLQKIKEESEEVAWTKVNPYVVPQNYFEQLAPQILARVGAPEKKALPTRMPLYRYVQLAAALAMIIFVGLGMNSNFDNNTIAKTDIEHISTSEIANYIDDNLDEFDTDMILNTLASNSNTSIIHSDDLSNEEIKSYLDEYGWN